MVNSNTGEEQRVLAPEYDGETPVYLERVKQIAAGTNFAAALLENGRVVTWGQNNYGQVGRGDTSSGAFPSYVVDGESKFIENIKQIACRRKSYASSNKRTEKYIHGE